MVQNDDLKAFEKRIYRSFFDDGLWDISYGIILFAWMFIEIFPAWGIHRYWAYALMFIPTFIITFGKRYITIPRMGGVQFGSDRAKRKRAAILALSAFVVMGLLAWLLVELGAFPKFQSGYASVLLTSLFIGLGFFFGFVLIAWLTDFQRLYIYAIFFGAGIPLLKILQLVIAPPWEFAIVYGPPALTITAYGIYLLFKFIHDYPRPALEVNNGIG